MNVESAIRVLSGEHRSVNDNQRVKFRNPGELRAAIVARLKLAEANGALVGKKAGIRYTVSVRWSGHMLSATVTIRGARDIVASDYVRRFVRSEEPHRVSRLTGGAQAMHAAVRLVLAPINYDASRRGEDYTDVGFFLDVRFDETEGAEWRALVARFEAELAGESLR